MPTVMQELANKDAEIKRKAGLLRDVETILQIIEMEGSERMRNALADVPMRVRAELNQQVRTTEGK